MTYDVALRLYGIKLLHQKYPDIRFKLDYIYVMLDYEVEQTGEDSCCYTATYDVDPILRVTYTSWDSDDPGFNKYVDIPFDMEDFFRGIYTFLDSPTPLD